MKIASEESCTYIPDEGLLCGSFALPARRLCGFSLTGEAVDVRAVPELGAADAGYPGVAPGGVPVGGALFSGHLSHVSSSCTALWLGGLAARVLLIL